MKKNKSKEDMTFEERVERFEKYDNDPEQHYKIYSELGFSYVDDGCDGFCPNCEQKDSCETYAEVGWELFENKDSD
jgi:hypothetical protein